MAKLENLLNAKTINYPTREQRDDLGMYDWWNDNKITQETVTLMSRVAKAWKQAKQDETGDWYAKENHAGGHYDQVGLDGVFNIKKYQNGYATRGESYYVAMDSEKQYTKVATLKAAIEHVLNNLKKQVDNVETTCYNVLVR